jgi:hypothetical protein
MSRGGQSKVRGLCRRRGHGDDADVVEVGGVVDVAREVVESNIYHTTETAWKVTSDRLVSIAMLLPGIAPSDSLFFAYLWLHFSTIFLLYIRMPWTHQLLLVVHSLGASSIAS